VSRAEYDLELLKGRREIAQSVRNLVGQLEAKFPVQVGAIRVWNEDRRDDFLRFRSGRDSDKIPPIQLPDSIYDAYEAEGFAQTDNEREAFDLAEEVFATILELEAGNWVSDEQVGVLKSRFESLLIKS
jgi:hypothetical protein